MPTVLFSPLNSLHNGPASRKSSERKLAPPSRPLRFSQPSRSSSVSSAGQAGARPPTRVKKTAPEPPATSRAGIKGASNRQMSISTLQMAKGKAPGPKPLTKAKRDSRETGVRDTLGLGKTSALSPVIESIGAREEYESISRSVTPRGRSKSRSPRKKRSQKSREKIHNSESMDRGRENGEFKEKEISAVEDTVEQGDPLPSFVGILRNTMEKLSAIEKMIKEEVVESVKQLTEDTKHLKYELLKLKEVLKNQFNHSMVIGGVTLEGKDFEMLRDPSKETKRKSNAIQDIIALVGETKIDTPRDVLRKQRPDRVRAQAAAQLFEYAKIAAGLERELEAERGADKELDSIMGGHKALETDLQAEAYLVRQQIEAIQSQAAAQLLVSPTAAPGIGGNSDIGKTPNQNPAPRTSFNTPRRKRNDGKAISGVMNSAPARLTKRNALTSALGGRERRVWTTSEAEESTKKRALSPSQRGSTVQTKRAKLTAPIDLRVSGQRFPDEKLVNEFARIWDVPVEPDTRKKAGFLAIQQHLGGTISRVTPADPIEAYTATGDGKHVATFLYTPRSAGGEDYKKNEMKETVYLDRRSDEGSKSNRLRNLSDLPLPLWERVGILKEFSQRWDIDLQMTEVAGMILVKLEQHEFRRREELEKILGESLGGPQDAVNEVLDDLQTALGWIVGVKAVEPSAQEAIATETLQLTKILYIPQGQVREKLYKALRTATVWYSEGEVLGKLNLNYQEDETASVYAADAASMDVPVEFEVDNKEKWSPQQENDILDPQAPASPYNSNRFPKNKGDNFEADRGSESAMEHKDDGGNKEWRKRQDRGDQEEEKGLVLEVGIDPNPNPDEEGEISLRLDM